eukprot:tig00001371_g8436.t1
MAPGASLNDLPLDLLERVLHHAGARSSWRARRVSRAWKDAIEGMHWSSFELEVRTEAEAHAATALARDGRLCVRGDVRLVAAFKQEQEQSDEQQEQPVALLSALALGSCSAAAPGSGFTLREVDVRLGVSGHPNRAVLVGLRALDALAEAPAAGALRALAFVADAEAHGRDPRRPRPRMTRRERNELARATVCERLLAALPAFTGLERLRLPAVGERYRQLSDGCLAAVVDLLGPRLRELHAGGGIFLGYLLRCPLLERCCDGVYLGSAEDAVRFFSGLPHLRSARLDVSMAALRGLGGTLPAGPLRHLELALPFFRASNEGDVRVVAEALAAARGALEGCSLRYCNDGDASPALGALAACPRLRRVRVRVELVETEAVRAADVRALVGAALEPCCRAGAALDVDVRPVSYYGSCLRPSIPASARATFIGMVWWDPEEGVLNMDEERRTEWPAAEIAEAGPENIKDLDLSGNKLTSIPGAELAKLTSLEVLNLIDNELTALPAEIGRLAALRVIYLSYNQLTALPPEIGQLAALRKLIAPGNQLTALPPEISRLAALREVYVEENPLTAMPEHVRRAVTEGLPFNGFAQCAAVAAHLRSLSLAPAASAPADAEYGPSLAPRRVRPRLGAGPSDDLGAALD